MMSPDKPEERIVDLESVIAHLQHEVDQLNSVILSQQAEIDAVKQSLAKLESRVDRAESGPEVRDLEQEKPPHY